MIKEEYKACFIRRILVASNAIKTIRNEMINLIKKPVKGFYRLLPKISTFCYFHVNSILIDMGEINKTKI